MTNESDICESKEKKSVEDFKLKPCPFCGASAFGWHWNGVTRIDCSNWNNLHLVGIGAKTIEEAMEIWNRRV